MTQREREQLAVETGISLTTIRKWDKGGRVNKVLKKTIVEAVGKLGVTGPEVEVDNV